MKRFNASPSFPLSASGSAVDSAVGSAVDSAVDSAVVAVSKCCGSGELDVEFNLDWWSSVAVSAVCPVLALVLTLDLAGAGFVLHLVDSGSGSGSGSDSDSESSQSLMSERSPPIKSNTSML